MVLLGGKTNVEEAREGRGYKGTGEVLLNSDITPAYADLTLTNYLHHQQFNNFSLLDQF